MDWKLVPTRLTRDMAYAAKCIDARLSVWKYDDAYRAMLANAPEPPETSTPTVAQLQARVAELEAALAAEREVHVSVCSASDDELTKTRDALRRLEAAANSVAYCYSNRPENFAGALQSLQDDAVAAREVLDQ